jgi:predicted O-linked N-acetylglucosamine transferase (SPINDLY family)
MTDSVPTSRSNADILAIARHHRQAGEFAAAEALCRQLVEARAEPEYGAALHLLGLICLDAGQVENALRWLHAVMGLRPRESGVAYSLGEAYRASRRLQEAATWYGRALTLRPDFADAQNALGGVLAEAGRLAEAELVYRRLADALPGMARPRYNLGVVQRGLGKLADAEASFRQSLALEPNHPDGLNNLATVLIEQGRHEDVEDLCRRALALKPDHAEALNNLGALCRNRGDLQGAETSFRDALKARPDFASAHQNLALLLAGSGRLPEAAERFLDAHRLNPGDADVLAQWLHTCQRLYAWQDLEPKVAELRRLIAAGRGASPFTFLALPASDAGEQRLCASAFTRAAYRHFLETPPLWSTRRHPDHAKLRIGYLSADFFEHATSYLLAEVIELHERRDFEIFGYSYGPNDASPTALRIRSAFDQIRDLGDASHAAAAVRIFDDEIDVLVDLKGHTKNARLQITALRPAPLQVSWLGYPGTLGHERLADYVIGDPVVTPIEHARHYTEHLALMPHCYQPNDRQREIGPRPSRQQAHLPEDAFVFCSFNQSYKLTPKVFDVWCRLLHRVPGSVLWLLESTHAGEDNLRREAAARGIEPGRLLFAPLVRLPQHLARLQLADLGLDTHPYTSHTTASDLLWSATPLVTMIGETFASRVAASILEAAGLSQLVTRNMDEYFELASQLALDPEKRRHIRAALEEKRTSSPLFDTPQFTRDLEKLYRRAWDNLRSGKLEHFRVGAS